MTTPTRKEPVLLRQGRPPTSMAPAVGVPAAPTRRKRPRPIRLTRNPCRASLISGRNLHYTSRGDAVAEGASFGRACQGKRLIIHHFLVSSTTETTCQTEAEGRFSRGLDAGARSTRAAVEENNLFLLKSRDETADFF